MASSGLRENVILTKIILTIDGTNVHTKEDTWCQKGGWGFGIPWCRTILTSGASVGTTVGG